MTTSHTSGAADLPEAPTTFCWATELAMTQEPVTLSVAEAREISAEMQRLHALAAGQAAPAEPTPDELRAIARKARNSSGSASDDCGSAMYVLYGWRAAMSKVAPPAMDGAWKDHNTAQLVNELRDVAVEFHGAQQLRERIAHVIVPLTDKLKAAMDGGEDVARMDWIAVHGSFGVDSATGEVGGNGQKRLAATRKNIDAARAAQKENL